MNIWNKINHLLESRHNLYLLTVIQSEGSAPGRCGFKMVVADDGELVGSIGGGIMEFNMVEKAKLLLSQRKVEQYAIKQIHRGDAESASGMICSGSQTIGFNYLSNDDEAWVSICTQLPQMLQFTSNGIKPIEINNQQHKKVSWKSKVNWSYYELIHSKTRAHIFGAGHVSLPTSELLTKVGFDVYLYDDRENLNTYAKNLFTHSKFILNYTDIHSQVEINKNDYVLLMTHKFTQDKLLLSQFLNMNYEYLGVLGSVNKIKVMFAALVKEGCSLTQLDKVFAPIGININSQTTDEIAVSIVAEIIQLQGRRQ